MNVLELRNLSVKVEDKLILDDVSLVFNSNEVVALMGPNGAGKSTISNVIMGNPKYEVESGQILFNGEDITDFDVEKRAKLGIFMSFQSPVEISGVTLMSFLRTSYNQIKGKNLKTVEFSKLLREKMKILEMNPKFRARGINEGFSGGEKKRAEILQMLLLEPKFAILDEVDSGLDVDSLKLICDNLQALREEIGLSFMVITHYNKILDYLNPDKVVVLKNGKVVKVGDFSLAKQIEEKGFNFDEL